MESKKQNITQGEEDYNTAGLFIWNTHMIYALIEEYKYLVDKFQDPSSKKNLLWKQVSDNLKKKGYAKISDELCEGKWQYLEKAFKEVHLRKNAEPDLQWLFYEELEEVFQNGLTDICSLDLPPTLASHEEKDVDQQKGSASHEAKDVKQQKVSAEVMEVVSDSDTANKENDSDAENVVDLTKEDEPADKEWLKSFLNEYRNWGPNKLTMLTETHSEVIGLERRKSKLLSSLMGALGNSCGEGSTNLTTL